MSDSIERILDDVRNGDSFAGHEIYNRFADRIRSFAHSRLDARLNSKISADDIVQSVFRSFFRRNQNGRFEFENWNSLWGLLVTMAARKCYRKSQRFGFAKRDLRRESLQSVDHLSPEALFRSDPTPDQIAAVRDTISWSLSGMNEFQRDVVLLRLANFSTAEIGGLVGRTERTVRRILEKFRERLESQES